MSRSRFQNRDPEFPDPGQFHILPKPLSSSVSPRPVHGLTDPQAVLTKPVRRKEPCLHFLKARELMYFPGWSTRTPLPQRREQPRICPAVHLPPLPSTPKKVVSTPSLPQQPGTYENDEQPDPPPVQIHQYSKDDFLMISHDGVISVRKDECDFVTLDRWEEEHKRQSKIMSISFFARFKKWKPFHIWRRKVRAKKIHLARESLRKHLFIVNQSLSPVLIDVRRMCFQITDTGLCHMDKDHTYTLREFRETQFTQLQKKLKDLKKFEDLVKELTLCGCRSYVLEPQSKSTFLCDQKNKTLITQINKTIVSSRLVRFIRLVDYLVENTLLTLVVNGASRILTVFQEQVSETPSHAVIQSWSQHSAEHSDEPTDRESAESEPPQVPPLFMSRLLLDPHALTLDPSKEQFQEVIFEIIEQFEKTVKSVRPLTADPDLDSLIQPGEFQTLENNYEDGPDLEFILGSDGPLQNIIRKIWESVHVAFDVAQVYSHMFERFRLFYKDNESLDVDAMQQKDQGLSYFEKVLELYHKEHRDAVAIQPRRRLGLLLVDKTELREKLVTSPLRCLEVVNAMLTTSSRRKLDALIAEVCDAQFKLELNPSTSAEFASALTFLDEIQERILVLSEDQETVSQMYGLIKVYSVPTPPEDLVVFATLESSINSLQGIVVEAVAERETRMEMFGSALQKDLVDLNREIMKSKQKSQDPQILDINADSSQVRQLLGEIQISVDELQKLASTYIFYQKKFKMEVTAFDSLDELTAEIKLKELLWDSLEEWDSLHHGWWQITLEQLDVESLKSQVTKYDKHVHRLETELPRNDLVPVLKDKVETMKHKLPVISDLCHLCTKPKHWNTLESIMGTSLNVTEVTVALLENLNIFSYGAEIQEVSGWASGEDSEDY